MASKATARSFYSLIRRARPSCECAASISPSSTRQFSASTARREAPEYETDRSERPRWSYTPEKMKQPYRAIIKPRVNEWKCNHNHFKLDAFYIRFLGEDGDTVLSEEVKWLAITHKSYDQGRRGYNDGMAFLGRRILNLQTNLALLHSSTATKTQSLSIPSDDREPFTHPALEGLANLSNVPIGEVLTKERLAKLAYQMNMPEILRWLPKDPSNMRASGLDAVLATAVYGIVGAVALQKGGDVAARVARDRILKPLGIPQ